MVCPIVFPECPCSIHKVWGRDADLYSILDRFAVYLRASRAVVDNGEGGEGSLLVIS